MGLIILSVISFGSIKLSSGTVLGQGAAAGGNATVASSVPRTNCA